MLDLLPHPALVIDPTSDTIILDNTSARANLLSLSLVEGDSEAPYAELGGARIGLQGLARELMSSSSATEGVEVAWHVQDREYHFLTHCRALPRTDERTPLAVLFFVDVTAQRATEEALRRALEVRDEFFSIATHELKDPLFSLQLSNQLLRHTATRQGEVPPHILQHLEVSQRQTERLSRLIDNLLDVSRIMNRRLQLDVEALDLGELVRETADRYRDRAEAAGTSLSAEVAGSIIGYFDRLKVEQILGNLLTNALKYGGGRPVRVGVCADEETAVIEVEDQGPGIAPEDQARIFARFERASGGHRKESLGLGLYIVRSLVEAHGGSIQMGSEPGRGATFTVTLPRKHLSVAIGLSAEGNETGSNQE
jgi:signal transduction histidine kinase